MNMKRSLMRLHQLSSQFGIDPRRFLRALAALPAFINEYRFFRRTCVATITFNPQLHDRHTEAGVTKSEYFWQDLIVARWIFEAKPERHVDVGSRTDGFVAHVASFREIEVFDVRPITTDIPGVIFRQADLMDTEAMAAWQDGNVGGGTATRCPASMCSSTSGSVATAIPSTPTATRQALPISPACFAQGGISTSRRRSARSASSLTPTGSSIQPPFWCWLTTQGFGWSGSAYSTPQGGGCGSSARKSGAKPRPHSQPSTTTSASLFSRDPWRVQGSHDRHNFKSVRQEWWQATLAEPVSKQPAGRNQIGALS